MSKEHDIPEQLRKDLEGIMETEEAMHGLQEAIFDARSENMLASTLNPELLNPEIPLDDEELDSFISSFAENDHGRQLKEYIDAGSKCEARHDKSNPTKRCGEQAIASVDWYAISHNDSVLVCREDLRFVYKSIMTEDIGPQGLLPNLTINGKEVPRTPAEEL